MDELRETVPDEGQTRRLDWTVFQGKTRVREKCNSFKGNDRILSLPDQKSFHVHTGTLRGPVNAFMIRESEMKLTGAENTGSRLQGSKCIYIFLLIRRRGINVANNAFSSGADLAQASTGIAAAINTSSSAEKRANTHPLLYARRYPVRFCFCFRRSLSDASLPLSLLLVYRYPRLKTSRSIPTRSITTKASCQAWATVSLFRLRQLPNFQTRCRKRGRTNFANIPFRLSASRKFLSARSNKQR